MSAVFLILFTSLASNNTVNASSVGTISLAKSGLVVSDPLNNEIKTQQELQANPGYWYYNGDAPDLKANYTFFRDLQGLHVGAQAPANGTYAGFYAMSQNTNATLFHAIISTPVRTIPSNNNFFFNGIYVQTAQPVVNYVSCVSDTGKSGTVWTIGHTYGSSNDALVFDTLWTDTSQNQPLTRDCTIVTDGQNNLKAYLDGVLVYSSNTILLGMPAPFNAYLEPQNSYAGQMINGTYTDFYVTEGDKIQITNILPSAATVNVTDSNGNVLASSPVSNGKSTVDIGKYHFPLVANIAIYDSSKTLVASTPSPVNMFGGDVYAVDALNPTIPQSPTGLAATAISSSQINLSWTAPSDNGGSTITGYNVERSTDNGTTWSSASNATSTSYSDTGLVPSTTYTYRVSAINSVGSSSPSNTASATTYPSVATNSKLTVSTQNLNGASISGQYIELWQNGVQIDGGFSPVTFTLQDGPQYTVIADNYLTNMFDHWLDTGSKNNSRNISITTDTNITAVYRTIP